MKKVGIDGGGTLLKLCYEEGGKLHYKKYASTEMEQAMGWLKLLAPKTRAALTGGKGNLLKEKFFPEGDIVPEFQATTDGAIYLLKQKAELDQDPFIIINIGTGTSWHLVKGEKQERVLGSGIGGGTLLGLGFLLSDQEEFTKMVQLSADGNREMADLLVRDIYAPGVPPIEGSLTAGNFAKVSPLQKTDQSDNLAALQNMIAETIVLLSHQTSMLHGTKKLYFIGNTLSGNRYLKEKIAFYGDMLSLECNFIENGEYCGAVGAWLSIQ